MMLHCRLSYCIFQIMNYHSDFGWDIGFICYVLWQSHVFGIGVDLGGAAGARPPIIELVGQRYPFAPPIIQVRIFENIETTSETKTRNLTTTIYHNEINYF